MPSPSCDGGPAQNNRRNEGHADQKFARSHRGCDGAGMHLVPRPSCPSIRVAALGLTLLAFGCGVQESETTKHRCTGLDLDMIDSAVVPPANVAALVRVTDCDGGSLNALLGEKSFSLSENGELLSELETTRSVTPAGRQMEQRTLIALDLSGSIQRSGLKHTMVQGARLFVKNLVPTHHVAVFGFDGRTDLVPYSPFTDNIEDLTRALDRVETAVLVDDSTNLNGAIVSALRILDRTVEAEEEDRYSIARGSLVIFTDGKDQAGRVGRAEAEQAIEKSPHAVFAIQAGSETDEDMLDAIGKTGQFTATDPEAVLSAFDKVSVALGARARENYVVSYCSPARSGPRTLTITVRHEGLVGSAELPFSSDGFGAGCTPENSPLK